MIRRGRSAGFTAVAGPGVDPPGAGLFECAWGEAPAGLDPTAGSGVIGGEEWCLYLAGAWRGRGYF